MQQNMLIDQDLKYLFSTVYGQGSKQDDIAKKLFQKVKDFLKNDTQFFTKSKDKDILLHALTKASPDSFDGSTQIIFKCQFNCSIIIQKVTQQSPINIYIVSPEEWGSDAPNWQKQSLQFTEPKQRRSYFMSSVTQHETRIQDFVKKFAISLQKALLQIQQIFAKLQKQMQYSAKTIHKACKMAAFNQHFLTVFNDELQLQLQKQQQKKQQKNKKDKQKQAKKQFNSQVQNILLNNSQANTCWYVPQATIIDLLTNQLSLKQRLLIQKLIIGYKSYTLLQVTELKVKQNKYNQQQVSKLKKCLDQIIIKYKKSISIEDSKINTIDDFLTYIDKIYNNIKALANNGLTSQIIDQPQQIGKLKFQQPIKPFIALPNKQQHQTQKVIFVQIHDYPMTVNKRYPFQILLNIGKDIQKTKDLTQLSKWILLTQRTFFNLTQQFTTPLLNIIDLNIHMREIQCQMEASNLLLIVQKYQKILNQHKDHFWQNMYGQLKSHIQLIKTIAAIIAFQSVKMNRQLKGSNLNKYKIPIDIDTLYQGFISFSYEARRAMKNLYKYHNYRRHLQSIFVLNGRSNSFSTFAKIVAKQTRVVQVWIDNMKRLVRSQKQNIVNTVHLEDANQKLSKAKQQIQIANTKTPYYHIPSSTTFLKEKIISEKQQVLTEFNEDDPWLFAFLQNIPSDILGLMKIVYIAQNPKKDQKVQQHNLFNDHFLSEKFSIKLYSKKPTLKQRKCYLNSSISNWHEVPSFKFFEDVKVIFNGSSQAYEIKSQDFYIIRKNLLPDKKQDENKSFLQKIRYLIQRPSDEQKDREHKLYAKQIDRPQEIELQDFIAIGNIRSAENTQLMILCFNILQRKAISNSYTKSCLLAEQVILQTAGQLSAYKPNIEKQFKQIRCLIMQFINVWAFTDVNFCPILGPFIGYIGRELIDDQIPNKQETKLIRKAVFQLCKKCLQQYRRGQQQLKVKPHLKIQWDQRFIITAAISCLRQIILSIEDEQQILTLCSMIFEYRSCQIMSGRQTKIKGKRQFEKQLLFSIHKTIFYNIQVISTFLQNNLQKIGQIVKKIDPSYPVNIVWKCENLFSFSGKSQQSQDIYQIDLFTGKIFKNGKQISALDKKIKDNPYFVKIFGQDRQFQVFQSHFSHYLRTKNHVNHQFKIDQQKHFVFFEFSQDGKNIRYIINNKKNSLKEQQIWVLVTSQKLKQSKCHFPKLFMDHYMAWYCEQKQCLIFRKTNFDDMFNIGVIIHFDKIGNNLYFDKAYYIASIGNIEHQDYDQILDRKTRKYNEIILRNNQIKLEKIQCFQLLSRFEQPQYILELRNKDKNNIQYLLHRYQIKFFLTNQTCLSSQTYFGYDLDHTFYYNKNCLFNKFPCLVLKKQSNNQALLNNHKRIVVISDGRINLGGKIQKSTKANAQIQSFKYQIHDFYGDLRGYTRQGLFHLSAIMLSINDNINISSIEMTPLDYSIYLLKSCVTNKPYNQNQTQKLSNLLNLNPSQSILLLIQCLWKCSKALVDILPFQQKNIRFSIYDYGQKMNICKTLYKKNIGRQTVRYRQKISPPLLKYVDLIISQHNTNDEESSETQECSVEQNFIINNEPKYWKRMKKFIANKYFIQMQEIIDQFQMFNQTSKQICKVWKETINTAFIKINPISKQITSIAKNSQCNQMTKQMVNELEISSDVYLKEYNRISHIIQKLKGQKLSEYIVIINQMIIQGNKLTNKIDRLIKNIKQDNQKDPDILTGLRPSLSSLCFTSILCQQNKIKEFLPYLNAKIQKGIINTIKIWVELKTRIASFERLKFWLKDSVLDSISLMREAESPRDQVRKKPHWLCFQAQNKVQLWLSQLDTYHNLTKSGDFCQLNMGEGKTQVIIPLMILDAIYEKKKCIPRINLLSSLIDEARGNYFRFLSVTGFQIPGFQIPFSRQVQLCHKNTLLENIYQVRNVINSFSNRLYILMTKQSRLSQILRFYQVNKQFQQISIKRYPLIPQDFKIFDIYDEIDQLMTPIKSHIFSIGKTEQLPSSKQRFQILRVLIQIFLKKHLETMIKQNIVISQQTIQQTLKLVKNGNYPPGLRLNIQNMKQTELKKWKQSLVKDVINELNNDYFSFFKTLNYNQQNNLIEYIINPLDLHLILPHYIRQTWKNQIFILRGALGYGIFQHCLSMRCGVDYGVPKIHKKLIAVPYEAADIPSKTSQYQHPDVSILLSYLAYYTKGLTWDKFQKALQRLLSLSQTSKSNQYELWYKSLSIQLQEKIKIKNAQQINYNSKAVIQELFQFYRRNRKVISFWLNFCIFPTDLKQYKSSITASAWDLADVENCVGFSGTKDNHWLYSDKLNWKPCQTPSIKGTDGKMIHLITKNTIKICLIEQNNKNQWQRFIDTVLKQQVDCIIDAGALCVGKSLKDQIVPWVASHQKFKRKKFVGISFCDSNGKWQIYDIESKRIIQRGTSIPDHQTFVIFDEARTRGADLKMNSDVTAAISLGPLMTKDKFMQAAGRLRKLGRNQKLIIMATNEIFSSFSVFKNNQNLENEIKKIDREKLTNIILGWCINNSIISNEKLLIQFANLGWDHIRSKTNSHVYVKDLNSNLDKMYEHALGKTTVANLNIKLVHSLDKKYTSTRSGIHISEVLLKYGKNVQRQASNFDDICERQVQPQPQTQKQQQDEVQNLQAIPQTNGHEQHSSINGIPIVFNERLKLSSNFVDTTNKLGIGYIIQKSHIKQLSEVYFVLYDSKIIKAVTLRQASIYINNYIVMKNKPTFNIALLSNLTIENEFIKTNKLQSALISAKYLSGIQNYNQKEQQYLLKMFLQSVKYNIKFRQNYQKLTSIILHKKRVFYKKYFGSSLQKIVTRLKNQDI